MTFVTEKIGTDEQRAEFAGLGLISRITRRPAQLSEWVVDRERGLYFVNFGGGAGGAPYFLALADKDGLVLDAQAYEKSDGPYRPKGVEVEWTVESIAIPQRAAILAKDLVTALSDALKVYGSLGNAEVTKSVQVKLVSPRLV